MDLTTDARFGLRTLRRNISFSAAALFTLALGIGATTAIFSVVSGLILRPLPFHAPDRLVQVYGTSNLSQSDAVVGLPTLLTGIGLAVGVLAAYLASPLLRGLPISVRPPDALTTAPTAVAITVVAVLACLIPALRAARVDPMTALRNE